MAGSRLSNFGTIFTRVTGLLETKALHEKPLWYDVYRKFPPEKEPYSGRPEPPQDPIVEIVYEEDFERAKQAKATRKASGKKPMTGKQDKNAQRNQSYQ